MVHLYRFRKGWQSEHLAKFILSKFSFVAEPSTVSDDLGSDFFCTLFIVQDKDSLFPQNSFAIQIKSKEDMKSKGNKFEITNKTSYLNKLEIPFFVGVIDKSNLKLEIYSGECISNFFTHIGNPSEKNNSIKIFIELVENRGKYPLYNEKPKNNNYYLRFPKVIEIKSDYDYTENPNMIDELFKISRLIRDNISTKRSNEYIYKRYEDSWVDIYAGPGSAKTFRDNFLKRLAEVFYNLEWLYPRVEGSCKQKILIEFKIYKKFYLNLQKIYGSLPSYLTNIFDRVDKLLNNIIKRDSQ